MIIPGRPEKSAIARATTPALKGGEAVGAFAAISLRVDPFRGSCRAPSGGRPARCSTSYPILAAMLRAAALKDLAAVMAPLPLVERTHAWPRSAQTELICGMFGIGTPPFDAAENCARTGSLDFALMFAGGRPFAAASSVWAAGVARKFVTRSFAAASTPWAVAYFVT